MRSGRLPELFVGRRRLLLGALAGLGLVQAALTVLAAFLTPRLLGAGGNIVTLSAILVAAALLVGAARIGERVISEELGQDYVREVRRLLVASALTPERSINLGTTIARTTNDLTAVKNWVSLGISPIVVGVPLIAGIVTAMLLLTPGLAIVVAVTLAAFAMLMWWLSKPLLARAAGLRKVRGRMAGHISDTVTAGEAIRVSGGVDREVGRIDRLSQKVMDASRDRAKISGAMRGSAASVTALLSVLVAVVGASAGSTAADVTTAVFIAGLLAAPVSDLGRVSEYRQNLKAAEAVLEPVLAAVREHQRRERRMRRQSREHRHHGDPVGIAKGSVHVADLADREGTIQELVASPGSRVLLTGASSKRTERVLRELIGDRSGTDSWVQVAGRHIHAMPAKERRALVGFASRDIPIERTVIARMVRYRIPDSDETVEALLDRVGLLERVRALPDGDRTTLRRGGEPLTKPDRARLKLARAIAGNPPLLVLDHIDDQLDADGRSRLRAILDDYPGCVIIRSSNPEAIMDCHEVWNVDELRPGLVLARPAREIRERGLRATTHLVGAGTAPFGPPVRRSSLDREHPELQGDQELNLEEDDDA